MNFKRTLNAEWGVHILQDYKDIQFVIFVEAFAYFDFWRTGL